MIHNPREHCSVIIFRIETHLTAMANSRGPMPTEATLLEHPTETNGWAKYRQMDVGRLRLAWREGAPYHGTRYCYVQTIQALTNGEPFEMFRKVSTPNDSKYVDGPWWDQLASVVTPALASMVERQEHAAEAAAEAAEAAREAERARVAAAWREGR